MNAQAHRFDSRILRALFALLLVVTFTNPVAAQRGGRSPDPEEPVEMSERELRNEFKKAFGARDDVERADAVSRYGFATRNLPDNEAAEPVVARTLKNTLKDDAFAVQAAAIVQLSWGRDVPVVFDAMEDALKNLRNMAEKYSTRSDEEDREIFYEAERLYGWATEVVARHPDERAVKMLQDEMRQVEPGKGSAQLRAALVKPLAEGLLLLGTHDAVEAVVKKTNDFSGSVMTNRAEEGTGFGQAARNLHDALTDYAMRIGHRGPEFSERYDVFWRHWFDEIEDDLEDKLAKLEEPTSLPANEELSEGKTLFERDRR